MQERITQDLDHQTAFNSIKLKDRLTSAMLLQMSIRLTLIVVLVSAATYWHITTIYEGQVVETLDKYIKERSEKESAIFQLAADNHTTIKQRFLNAYQSGQNVTDTEFSKYFIKQDDGTTRLLPEAYYGLMYNYGDKLEYLTGFVGPNAPISEQGFRNKLNIAYHLMAQYGPAWVNRFESVYITMPENVVIIYWPGLPWAIDTPASLEVSQEPWFSIVMPENNPERVPVWTDLYYDSTAKDWMVSLETPVDLNGENLINIGHDILLQDLLDRIIYEKLEGSYNFMINKNGQLIVHPDIEASLKNNPSDYASKLTPTGPLGDAIKSIEQEFTGDHAIIFNHALKAWLAVAPIKGPDWLLVTVYPEDLVMQAARSTARFVLIIGLVSLVVEMLMLYLVTLNKVVRPLKMLGEASAQIGQANYQLVANGQIKLPYDRKDEVGILANAFKEMATRLFDYNNTLEHKVAERTTELVESRKKAESASKAKSNFLAHMSHEVRTPMNAIIGLSQLMLKTQLNKRQRDFMEKVLSSSDVLLNTINDVLDYSKIEANKLTLDYVPFDLRDVLRRVTNISAYKAQCKGVELLLDIDKKVPFLWIGDPIRLGQILINLASNAVKFTEKGEVIIRVKLIAQHDQQHTLRFSVIDTGIGIDKDRIEQLFSPFIQMDSSITRKYGGTGLGLAISRQLTELMGGRIWLESKLNVGSQFHFTCKLTLSESEQIQIWPKQNRLKGKRALIVDDNAMAREVLADILDALSLQVTRVPDGYAALDELEKASRQGSPYDAVFLDWNIPGLNGVETAVRIANNPNITLPAAMLMVTAYDVDKFESDAHEANIKKIIAKPVDASSIHDSLMEIFFQEKAPCTPLEKRELNLKSNLDLSALRGKQVLIVDDSILNREVATEFLNDVGIIVTTANNGIEALEKVLKQPFDLVLMDVQMPVMDGLSATQEIRKKPQLAHLPIIAMTAHASPDDYKRSLDAGMNDHLNKPIDHQLLYLTITRWIDASATISPLSADAPIEFSSYSDKMTAEPFEQPANTCPIQLSGFDTQFGLEKHQNKIDLYLKMLNMFYNEYRHYTQLIDEMIKKQDYESLNRFFHTVKSSAASLGELTLSEQAAQLESQCLSFIEATAECNFELFNHSLADFCKQFNHALDVLTSIPQRQAVSRPVNTQDNPDIQQIIAQLNRFLNDDDAAAERLVDELKNTPIAHQHQAIMDNILLCIQEIDYQAASEHLQELTSKIKDYEV